MGPVLYLDYDGVLHPPDVRVTKSEPLRPRIYDGGRPTDHVLFEHAALLERILLPFQNVRIILSTSWVRMLGYEYTVQHLPASLQERVIGTVWRGFMLMSPPPTRHDAILTDAQERGIDHWLALDDDVDGWHESRMHLVVAPRNPWLGLAEPGLAEELSLALELLSSGQPLDLRLPNSGEPKMLSTVERLFGID